MRVVFLSALLAAAYGATMDMGKDDMMDMSNPLEGEDMCIEPCAVEIEGCNTGTNTDEEIRKCVFMKLKNREGTAECNQCVVKNMNMYVKDEDMDDAKMEKDEEMCMEECSMEIQNCEDEGKEGKAMHMCVYKAAKMSDDDSECKMCISMMDMDSAEMDKMKDMMDMEDDKKDMCMNECAVEIEGCNTGTNTDEEIHKCVAGMLKKKEASEECHQCVADMKMMDMDDMDMEKDEEMCMEECSREIDHCDDGMKSDGEMKKCVYDLIKSTEGESYCKTCVMSMEMDMDKKAMMMGDCVMVNHIYDNPGELTCECLPEDDPCFADGHCVKEPRCKKEMMDMDDMDKDDHMCMEECSMEIEGCDDGMKSDEEMHKCVYMAIKMTEGDSECKSCVNDNKMMDKMEDMMDDDDMDKDEEMCMMECAEEIDACDDGMRDEEAMKMCVWNMLKTTEGESTCKECVMSMEMDKDSDDMDSDDKMCMEECWMEIEGCDDGEKNDDEMKMCVMKAIKMTEGDSTCKTCVKDMKMMDMDDMDMDKDEKMCMEECSMEIDGCDDGMKSDAEMKKCVYMAIKNGGDSECKTCVEMMEMMDKDSKDSMDMDREMGDDEPCMKECEDEIETCMGMDFEPTHDNMKMCVMGMMEEGEASGMCKKCVESEVMKKDDDHECSEACATEVQNCADEGHTEKEDMHECIWMKNMEADGKTPCAMCVAEMMDDCVMVNHIYDNPGELTCECLPKNDPCFADGHCVKEPRCKKDMGSDSMDMDSDEMKEFGDCMEEISACMEDTDVDMENEDEAWKCIVKEAAMMENVKCGAVMTKGDSENKGHAGIGKNCLPEMAWCADTEDTIDDVFEKCLIPGLETEHASMKCKTFFKSMGMDGDLPDFETDCATELATCLSSGIDLSVEFEIYKCLVSEANMAANTRCGGALTWDGEMEGKKNIKFGMNCLPEITTCAAFSESVDDLFDNCLIPNLSAGELEGMCQKMWNDEFANDGMKPSFDKDCSNEMKACMGDDDMTEDEFFTCIVSEAAAAENRKCGGALTHSEENDDMMSLGMDCLPELATCASEHSTADETFEDCLVPKIARGEASEECKKTMIKIAGTMDWLRTKAEASCPAEADICLGRLGLKSTDDLDDTTEGPMMACVKEESQSQKCTMAIMHLMAAANCMAEMESVDYEDSDDMDLMLKACMSEMKESDDMDCVMVNHIYDNPGELTCECLPEDDPCLADKQCEIEPRCKKGSEDDAEMCQVCAPYYTRCSKGSDKKMEIAQCMLEKAGMDSECGECLLKHMKDDGDDDEPDMDDCEDEYNACATMGVKDDDRDGMFVCLIQQSDQRQNKRCAGLMTMGEKGEGDARIGKACLADLTLCATLTQNAERTFSQCLIPAVEAQTVSDECLAAFAEIYGGDDMGDDHIDMLEKRAERACMNEARVCMGIFGYDNIDDLTMEEGWNLMQCVHEASESDQCTTAITNLMTAHECRNNMPEESEDDGGLMKCINAGGMDGMFVKKYSGKFSEFNEYCGKQRSQVQCDACSGKFKDGTCTAPNKPKDVKCNNVINMEICEAIGCSMNKNKGNCRGRNHWRN